MSFPAAGDERPPPEGPHPGGPAPAWAVVADEIGRVGPVPFSRFMELALYAPGVGFYETGGAAGRAHGDFLTSPEVGPLFGAVLARALDTWWDDLGQPDPYVVTDAGAGPGTLAVAVRAAAPQCAPALRYVLVERSAAQRAGHGRHLDLHPSGAGDGDLTDVAIAGIDAKAIGTAADIDATDPGPGPGGGPIFVSQAELPAGPFTGAVVANELLDNLPFDVVERTAAGWVAVHVGVGSVPETLVEVPVAVPAEVAARADALAPDAVEGDRFPLQHAAAQWLRDARDRVGRGRIVVFDYAATTPELIGRGTGWLRTYRRHGPGGHPLEAPGSQDVTADLAVDQLAAVWAPDRSGTQAEFLGHHGMDDLVAEGRRIWTERAHLGDLEAIRARSRIGEAEALADPSGLGAFRVLEWEVAG